MLPMLSESNIESLLTKDYKTVHHPILDKYYFYEYKPLLEKGKAGLPYFKKSFSFDDFCRNNEDQDLKQYIDNLIDVVGDKIPVLQFNRTAFRTKWFKTNYPGSFNLYLIRNPRDQWKSYFEVFKSTNYAEFFLMDLLLASVNKDKEDFNLLSKNFPLIRFNNESLDKERGFYQIVLDSYSKEEKYFIFYYMWFKALIDNVLNADLVINMNLLSSEPSYKAKINEGLILWGIDDIDFNDSKLREYSLYPLSSKAMDNIEERVQRLLIHSLTEDQINCFFQKFPQEDQNYFYFEKKNFIFIQNRKNNFKPNIQKKTIEKLNKMVLLFADEFFKQIERSAAMDKLFIMQKDSTISEKDQIILQKYEKFQKQEFQLAEKDVHLKRKDLLIDEKDQMIILKDQEIEKRDLLLAKKDEQLIEKDRIIAEKDFFILQENQEIERKKRQLEEKNEEPKGKDLIIAEKDQVILRRDQEIEKKDRQLFHKDTQLKKKDSIIVEKDEQLAGKDNLLNKKDEQIGEINRKLMDKMTEKDQQLAWKDTLLSKKDEQLAEKDRKLKDKLAEKDEQISRMNRQIQKVLDSYTYQISKVMVFPFKVARKPLLKLSRRLSRFYHYATNPISINFEKYEKKVNLSDQLEANFGRHRSGWVYAVQNLKGLHNPRGILLDTFIERTFCWHPWGVKPHLGHWIGFIHVPPKIPKWFHYEQSNEMIFKTEAWEKSLHFCKGLFTLSNYHREDLEKKLDIPVNNLIFPTGIPNLKWNWDKFAANKEKKIVQVGWWLRKLHAIYQLPQTQYKKVFLNVEHESLPELIAKEREILIKEGTFNDDMYNTVKTISYLQNKNFDRLLCENIVFVHLYDASANNTVIECIVRNTPLLVNPIEAIKEYLGEDYPFYYNSLEEAVNKAMDMDLIYKTHQFLVNHPIKKKLTGENFLNSFVNSKIYLSLKI